MVTLWIARDKSGLYLFRDKPEPDKGNKEYWDTPYWGCMPIGMNLFPEVTFKNSPQQVELKLKGMDEWEYKTILVGRGGGIIQSQLDEMKTDGWFMESQNGLECIFKRKIQ